MTLEHILFTLSWHFSACIATYTGTHIRRAQPFCFKCYVFCGRIEADRDVVPRNRTRCQRQQASRGTERRREAGLAHDEISLSLSLSSSRLRRNYQRKPDRKSFTNSRQFAQIAHRGCAQLVTQSCTAETDESSQVELPSDCTEPVNTTREK